MRASHLLLPILLGCTALTAIIAPARAQGEIGVSITLAPPPLPDYEQPPMPAYGYIWTPGFWQYGGDGYYWVPGTWVEPPVVGLLWTPGYWGWSGGFYRWNAPYWGAQVGYYGGINYGYGYGGNGYGGGRWEGGRFAYNRSANNFGEVHITNIYNTPIENHTPFNHVSFNGGTNGVRMQPTSAQVAVGREQHTQPTQAQAQHFQAAQANPALRQRTNNGVPPIAATSRPGQFAGQGVVPGRGAAGPVAPRPIIAQPANPTLAPQAQHVAPPVAQPPRAATPAQMPQQQQQHQTPAPQPQHAAPAPPQHAAPPQPQAAPQQQHQAPAPQQHAAPPPQPPQHAAPAQEKKPGG